jgi:DNA-binding transcriptional LysR family regulator
MRAVHLNIVERIMQHPFTIDLAHLRTLRELRERGTVTATAAALHLTPSAVSQQLAALSKVIAAPLLARHGRGVRLTPQAVVLLEHAELVHAQLERAQADIAAFDAGKVGGVAVAAFATAIQALVVPSLAILSAERPRLKVAVEEEEAPQCFSRLDAGAVDLVITVDYALGPSSSDSRYRRVELLRDPLRAVVPDGHALSGCQSVSIADLANEGWIVGTPGHPCFDITLAAYAAAGVTPRIAHRTNDWQAMLSLIASGAGVGLIPALALDRGRPGVVALPIQPQEPARSIYAAVRRGSENAPHIAAVVDALRAVAGKRQQELAEGQRLVASLDPN